MGGERCFAADEVPTAFGRNPIPPTSRSSHWVLCDAASQKTSKRVPNKAKNEAKSRQRILSANTFFHENSAPKQNFSPKIWGFLPVSAIFFPKALFWAVVSELFAPLKMGQKHEGSEIDME